MDDPSEQPSESESGPGEKPAERRRWPIAAAIVAVLVVAGVAWSQKPPSLPLVWTSPDRHWPTMWAADGATYYAGPGMLVDRTAWDGRFPIFRYDAATGRLLDEFSFPVDDEHGYAAMQLELPDGRVVATVGKELWVGRLGDPDEDWKKVPLVPEDQPQPQFPAGVFALQLVENGTVIRGVINFIEQSHGIPLPQPRMDQPRIVSWSAKTLERRDEITVEQAGRVAAVMEGSDFGLLQSPDSPPVTSRIDLRTGQLEPLGESVDDWFQFGGLWNDDTVVQVDLGTTFGFGRPTPVSARRFDRSDSTPVAWLSIVKVPTGGSHGYSFNLDARSRWVLHRFSITTALGGGAAGAGKTQVRKSSQNLVLARLSRTPLEDVAAGRDPVERYCHLDEKGFELFGFTINPDEISNRVPLFSPDGRWMLLMPLGGDEQPVWMVDLDRLPEMERPQEVWAGRDE